jgi:hypothetical protein
MSAARRSALAALAAAAALLAAALAPAGAAGAFGVEPGSFFAGAHDTVPLLEAPGEVATDRRRSDLGALRAAAPADQAGAHPDATASVALNAYPNGSPVDNVKDARVALPPGFLGDPLAVPACSRDAFTATYAASGNEVAIVDGCPVASQVGVATLVIEGGSRAEPTVPVYRVTTAHGSPAPSASPTRASASSSTRPCARAATTASPSPPPT